MEQMQDHEVFKQSSTFNGTVITIENYEKFQSKKDSKKDNKKDSEKDSPKNAEIADKYGVFEIDNDLKRQPKRQQKRQQKRQPKDTIKESKEDIRSTSTVPTFPEIDAFVTKNHLNVDARKFYDFYASRSWQTKQGEDITDWKALVFKWHSTERHSPPQPKDTYSLLPRLTLDDE